VFGVFARRFRRANASQIGVKSLAQGARRGGLGWLLQVTRWRRFTLAVGLYRGGGSARLRVFWGFLLHHACCRQDPTACEEGRGQQGGRVSQRLTRRPHADPSSRSDMGAGKRLAMTAQQTAARSVTEYEKRWIAAPRPAVKIGSRFSGHLIIA